MTLTDGIWSCKLLLDDGRMLVWGNGEDIQTAQREAFANLNQRHPKGRHIETRFSPPSDWTADQVGEEIARVKMDPELMAWAPDGGWPIPQQPARKGARR